MSGSANISSLDAISRFAAAVLAFQEEAYLCLSAMESQMRQIQLWLERDRPVFWKREVETCTREVAEARVRLHQCRMRRVGDFRPTCFEEQKDVELCKRNLDFAQNQIPTVKRWHIAAQHEANEFHGRAGQIQQILQREIPQLLSVLRITVDRITRYADVAAPEGRFDASQVTKLAAELEQTFAGLQDSIKMPTPRGEDVP